MSALIRVLVVDDSAFARKVLREALSTARDIEVVGVARDGLEALEKIAQLNPDVITLDLVMPNLDGLGVLESLPAQGAPRVVIVSISDASSELAIRALQAGAVDLVQKPTALATDQLYELGDELVLKVRAAARARSPGPVTAKLPGLPRLTAKRTTRRIMVVGTSTGGPQALTRLLSRLPADFPLPIAVALHIPAGYTHALAERLHSVCAIAVEEASPELVLRPGLAVVARGGIHLKLQAGGQLKLDMEPRDLLHYPSVNVLFQSAVDHYGKGVLGVVLTGMGDDGLRGSQAICEAGGIVLTESESSCVIYGMPRCVREAGYSLADAPIDELAAQILLHL